MGDVTYYAVLIIAAAILQGIVRTFTGGRWFDAGRNIEYDFAIVFFAHLQKLPPVFCQ